MSPLHDKMAHVAEINNSHRYTDEYSEPEYASETTSAPAGRAATAAPMRGLAMILIAVAVLLALWGVFSLIDSKNPNETVVAGPSSTSSSTAATSAPNDKQPHDGSQAPAPAAEGQKDPAKEPNHPKPGAVEPKQVPIATLNNSTITGLADNVSSRLREDGWTISEVGNFADVPIPETTVFYTPGNADEERAAKQLAQELGVVAAERTEVLDGAPAGVVLILTQDLQQP